MRSVIVLAFCILFSFSLQAQKSPQYEFRAVWIATVENIDWPSKKGLPVEKQKEEFIRILDMHKRNGMNAVVMQIRPVADAFYPSRFEPWSEYLTGKQGQAPDPYYDPLQFMIEECHKRGMEFHAWMNPYRAVFNVRSSSISPTHVTRLFPQWFLTYGSTKYFDPGLPEVREHVNKVVRDLVERYDLDAIHFDDYFYPYRVEGKDFPDAESFAKYGNGMSKDDWRRSNVDSIIVMLGKTIKSVNPRVKFGISPFGVWRNKRTDPRGSESKASVTNYDDLYADILLWLENGWIDYVAPQLYWETTHPYVGFYMLLNWWANNTYGRQLFIGQGIYRALEPKSLAWHKKNELPNQINAIRSNPNTLGSIYFSSATFSSNPNGWNDSLRNNYYKYPAIIPPMRWIDSIPPLAPLFEKLKRDQFRVYYRGAEPIKGFAVYTLPRHEDENTANATLVQILIADKTIDINLDDVPVKDREKVFIASIDRNNNVSEWVKLK
ncbi:MAG: family 10 glycosylhydrolase [Bacteroidota bacterium]|nr:family 10 glycosylhydrolase [Bacteroidota bacterium]